MKLDNGWKIGAALLLLGYLLILVVFPILVYGLLKPLGINLLLRVDINLLREVFVLGLFAQLAGLVVLLITSLIEIATSKKEQKEKIIWITFIIILAVLGLLFGGLLFATTLAGLGPVLFFFIGRKEMVRKEVPADSKAQEEGQQPKTLIKSSPKK